MTLDWIILYGTWGLALLGMVWVTPVYRIREAMVIFTFKQLLTWFSGLLVTQYDLIEYPVRIMSRATTTSITFEYFIYPATCVIFVLKFPENRSLWVKILWYLFFPTWMTIVEVLIEHYTNLIHYVHWNWFFTWITLLITFVLSRLYYLWFFRKFKGQKKDLPQD